MVEMTHKADKLLVAKCQLETAIELFFNDRDPHSIHTLASAAYEIFDTLCEKKGLERGVVHTGLQMIAPEHHSKVWNAVYKMKKYLKHADNDHEETVEWNPEISVYFIWDSTNMYRRLTADTSVGPSLLFSVWFRSVHGNLWTDQPENSRFFEQARAAIESLGKRKYYESFTKE